jgi:hypothetical protein
MLVGLLALLAIPSLIAREAPAVIRKLELGDVMRPQGRGQVMKPQKVTSVEEFSKIFDKDVAAKLLKPVDLTKEYLLVFQWAGSGSDRLSGEAAKDGKSVQFSYQRGLTKDLRFHCEVYVIQNGVEWKFAQ